jgi:hypothetical protein
MRRMKLIRRIHGWLGVLFAPSLILFCLSGIFQMYGCHEAEDGDQPAGWIVTIAQVHMHQTTSAPRRRPRPAAPARTDDTAAPVNGAVTTTPGVEDAAPGGPGQGAVARAAVARDGGAPPARPKTGAIKAFFLLMSLALIGSSVLGVYIAVQSKRDRTLHLGLLVAGFVVPIVLLLLI